MKWQGASASTFGQEGVSKVEYGVGAPATINRLKATAAIQIEMNPGDCELGEDIEPWRPCENRRWKWEGSRLRATKMNPGDPEWKYIWN